ncbi:MAG: hypothetical protein JRI95_10230 [Deltaproteobacteria bacterium]|nr:hypothetical protein [Deltaproteobacteria bacterium]MBW2086880.1 hypothetical protein [Deltaproteobacteria bacterium]
MLFFRSEEHLRNWAQFDPATIEGVISLPDLVKLFSGNFFRRRLDPDYVSHMRDYGREMVAVLQELEKAGSFWQLQRS